MSTSMSTSTPKVSTLRNKRGNTVANHFVIHTNSAEFLQGYQTIVARKDESGIALSEQWDCSRTTAKYVVQFLGAKNVSEVRAWIKSGKVWIDPSL